MIKLIRGHLTSGMYLTVLMVLTVTSFVLFFNFFNATLPVSELIVRHTITAKILYFIFAFSPLAWLLFSKVWRDTVSISRKILLIGLGSFLISLFYSTRYGINAGAVFIACSLYFAYDHRRIYKRGKVFYWFWAYLLIHAISLLWTNDLNGGLNKLSAYLPFATFPIAFCFFQLTREETDRLLLLFFRGATIFIFLSLFCWIYESSRIGVPLTDWFVFHKKVFDNQPPFFLVFNWTSYNHPSYNSISYILALAIGIYLFDKRKSSSNISYFELAIFAIAAFVLTIIIQSRIGLVNFLVVIVCGIAWLLRRERIQFYLYLFACFLLIAFAFTRMDVILKFINDPVREQQYTTALYSIKTNSWFGTGIGGMTKAMTSQELALKLGYPSVNVINIYPSNQFLGDLMQTGILGLIALVGILFVLSYNCIKQRNWVLFSIIICFLLLMMIEMPFFLLRGTTLFVPLSCLALQMQYKKVG
ncbi:MAG: O-antigen ligase family protein [Bacteroidota bacterium]|nr:O-antigen ligase family protein [Bacteroidota bacterium]